MRIKLFNSFVNEEAKSDKKQIIAIKEILKETLRPGTDKGSTQAIIDTKDFEKAAVAILKHFQGDVNERELPEYNGPRENDHFSNMGMDEDGNIIGNCKKCNSAGVLVHDHKCTSAEELEKRK